MLRAIWYLEKQIELRHAKHKEMYMYIHMNAIDGNVYDECVSCATRHCFCASLTRPYESQHIDFSEDFAFQMARTQPQTQTHSLIS